MKKVLFIILAITLLIVKVQSQTVTDIDGNVYNVISIGTQKWFQKNLSVIRYNNGDPIQKVTDTTVAYSLTSGAYYNYNNDSNIALIYGKLYNWYAGIDNRKICPVGYHVPTHADYIVLDSNLSSWQSAGGELKEIGTAHWLSPNTGATNFTGFTALPGGRGFGAGAFASLQGKCYLLTSTLADDTSLIWVWSTSYNSALFGPDWTSKFEGYAVRCICDTAVNGIIENSQKILLNISPNPFTQSTQITLPQTYHSITLEVYDLQGKLMRQHAYADCDKIQLERRGLLPGLYFLKLTLDEKWVQTGKVVVSE
jgi:uncharacterized protein (TIGR02145 family)